MHPKEISGGVFCRCEGTEQLRNILSVGLQLYLDLLKMPDIPYILFDRTVRGELSCGCGVEHRSSRPPLLVAVCLVDLLMSFRIGTEVL